MGREERIEQLVVSPGRQAGIADRDPGWTGGRDYEGLSQEELKAEAKAVLAQGVEDLGDTVAEQLGGEQCRVEQRRLALAFASDEPVHQAAHRGRPDRQ